MKCSKCNKSELKIDKIQLDLGFGNYSETTFGECPICGYITDLDFEIKECEGGFSNEL